MRHPAIVRNTLVHDLATWSVVACLCALAGCAGPRPGSEMGLDPGARDAAAWHAQVRTDRAALTAQPDDLPTLHRLAHLYAEVDSAEVALGFCEQILALDPDHDGGLSIWSKLQFDRGEHTRAIERLQQSRQRRGELSEVLRAGLALHLDAAGDFEQSAREFEQLRAPSSAKVYHVLRSDDYLHAGELARAALDAEPDCAASHNNFGITRLYEGDPESARASFLRALELRPDHASALYNLAIVDAFYFFDEAKGRDWFELYRATGAFADPDGLGELLAGSADPTLGEQARR